MAERKQPGRTRARRAARSGSRAKKTTKKKTQARRKPKVEADETTIGSRAQTGGDWEGLDGSAEWPRKQAPAPAPVAETVAPEPEPVAAPEPEPGIEASPAPTPEPSESGVHRAPARIHFSDEDWVTVRYEGTSMFRHAQAGIFVWGTTTQLKGDMARELLGVPGFHLRRAG